MNALVLSGGSIKGAFQAGALEVVLNGGFKPDIIYGISVGSLNGALISNEAGKTPALVNFPQIGKMLVDFWKNNIKKPADIARKRTATELGKALLLGKFNGLIDTDALGELLRRTVSMQFLRKSPLIFRVGAVNMFDGTIVYKDNQDPDFIDYIQASTAIPIMMPLSVIKGQPYYDGGVRDIAPLKQVIEAGADKIVVILCQSEKLTGGTFETGKLGLLAERLMEIIANEIVNNDIERMSYVNKQIDAGLGGTKRKIDFKLIRPEKEIKLKIDEFNEIDIMKLINDGRAAANKAKDWRN